MKIGALIGILGSVGIIAVACGGVSPLGDGDGSGGLGKGDSGGGGYEPCAGKACGAACAECDPADPTCVETRSVKYCTEEGECTDAFPGCAPPPTCSADSDCPVDASCQICPDGSCAGAKGYCVGGTCRTEWATCGGSTCKSDVECPAVGAPCEICPDGTASCPSTRCEAGACVTEWPACGGWDPCGDRSCGAQCSLCDPKDPACSETAVLKFCDAGGRCQPQFPNCGGGSECQSDGDCAVPAVCQLCPDGSCAGPIGQCVGGECQVQWDTCDGSSCSVDADCPAVRAPCEQCANGTASCPESRCEAGQCVTEWSGCSGWDPCTGKACGADCTLCDPKDPTCVEPAVVNQCDAAGRCQPGTAACPGGGGACTSAMDCPQIEICRPCPSGDCANIDCVRGSCGFTCP